MRRVLMMPAVALAVMMGGSTAEAARIHHYAVAKPPPPTHLSFTRFLEGGPTLWSHTTPRVPRGLAIPRMADGEFAPGLFLDFLLYRRALDPRRFDCHHPTIGLELANYLPPLPALSVPTIGPQEVLAPLVATPTRQVPEPSSLLIGGMIVAGVAFVKRRRARERG